MTKNTLLVLSMVLGLSASSFGDDGLLGGGNGGGSGGGSSVSSSGGSSSGSGSGGGHSSGSSNGGGRGQSSGGGRSSSSSSSSDSSRQTSNSSNQAQMVHSSRSGRVNYRSNNNVQRTSRTDNPIIVSSAPSRQPSGNRDSRGGSYQGSVRHQAGREDDSYTRDRYRSGYYQYGNSWCDDNFYYPYYSFNWNSDRCAVSPWYSYTNLPPYINISRVRLGGNCIDVDDWRSYRYDSRYKPDTRDWDYGLWDACYDLERTFLRGDIRRFGDLLEHTNWVLIDSPNGERYQIHRNDMIDMMADLVYSTRTTGIRFSRVEYDRQYARVVIQHTFEDAWRRRQTTYLNFVLIQDGRGYELLEFGTDYR